jgi:hypothetical protein
MGSRAQEGGSSPNQYSEKKNKDLKLKDSETPKQTQPIAASKVCVWGSTSDLCLLQNKKRQFLPIHPLPILSDSFIHPSVIP